MKSPEEQIAERFGPDEDDGYFIAEPETEPPPAPAQQTIALTQKQIDGLKRYLAALSIGVSATRPTKNKRKNRQRARSK